MPINLLLSRQLGPGQMLGTSVPEWKGQASRLLVHRSDTRSMGTMGASEGPPEQQLAVLPLLGVLALIFIVGGVLLYRFRSSAQSQKADEIQVALRSYSI